MATPSVLTFDTKGRAVDFEVWVDDLQLFLQSDRADGLSLFDLTCGASPALPATAYSSVRSQWATRDAAARLARDVPPPPSCPLLLLVLRPTSLASSRSAMRLPLAKDAAQARARGARALEGLAGVEGVGVVVGVVAGVEVSVAAVEAEESAAVAEGAEAAEAAEVAEAAVELVAALRREVAGGGPRQQQQRSRTGETAALGASASAAPGAGESTLSGTTSAEALHTFTLDSGASRSFFRDRTTLTPLSRPVAVSLADPSGGPVLAIFSTVLPCPAAPSGTLSGLYLPSFSTNLVSGADLQDRGVDQFTPASQRVTHCTCAQTGRHLATFTRRPGSSLYTLTTESPPVDESGQVAASSQVFAAASRSGQESASCSCRLLSHQTLLWHHRLGHPSLPRLRGIASRVLVCGLPRSLPPLPPCEN
ncbi:unnamed protein product [Closterium sp. NIES-65]|nr:unnamed protein product [Closterium sp. NIES-65]CAI6003102.1 unnamed protein product [Closterium sp. NIES-65]